ncbi:hypothetical protein ACFW2S_27375, partial [Streptomyces sp. NPDC058874]
GAVEIRPARRRPSTYAPPQDPDERDGTGGPPPRPLTPPDPKRRPIRSGGRSEAAAVTTITAGPGH